MQPPVLNPESMDYEEAANPTNAEIIANRQEAEEIPIDQIVTTPKKRMRYLGDILDNKITDMSPRTMIKSIRILKRACEEKTKTIKRLCCQTRRQKRKIKNISAVLTELQQKCLLSSESCNVLQVLEKIRIIIK
ncbi:uncharacterized protein LOC118644363 [Monomorium pharaonis]|uniref:uncharacterized protein LOC118644363 n=1 Tax=Monomorium pharaonis TaxID=307658 RepID=UPI001745C855|nr:uncharacterized protein LOC118644363 [Monomorium pharaonis]